MLYFKALFEGLDVMPPADAGVRAGIEAEAALQGSGLSSKDVARSRNYFALGLLYWLYSRPLEQQLDAIAQKFAQKPEFVAPNQTVFKAFARALRMALTPDPRSAGVIPSTKGSL